MVEARQASSSSVGLTSAFRGAGAQTSYVTHFAPGERFICDGVLTQGRKPGGDYASVPLARIEKGTAAIIEDGRAVKQMSAGDVFGVFETACFLKFGRAKRVGRWSFVANEPVRVKVLTDRFWQSAPDGLKREIVDAATGDHVPKPISRLPVLDAFAAQHGEELHSDTMLLFHSHLLETNYDLIKHLATLFGYHNTFVLEKPYSTIPSAFRKIVQTGVHVDFVKIDERMPYDFSIQRHVDYVWRRAARHAKRRGLKRVVILSDGGDLLVSIPWSELDGIDVVAVEQTQRGVQRIQDLNSRVPPTVSVATCAAKKVHESPFIGDAVFRKIQSRGVLGKGHVFGVLGCGAIGTQIAEYLHRSGETVLVYENGDRAKPEGVTRVHSLEEVVQESDIVIGTSGTDVLRGLYVERLVGHKVFISASSSNVEFAYLFDLLNRYANRFEDVTGEITDRFSVTVANGGYPLNFDREREWESAGDIQLTRTLLYAGVIQALSLSQKDRGKVIPLASAAETEVLELWKDFKKRNF